ncbi:MAG: efflux RND transporter periplasmic adaptor subunit [Rubrivivax sp.]
MNDAPKTSPWATIAGTAIVATAVGFGAARLLTPAPAKPVAAEQAAARPEAEPKSAGQTLKIPANYLVAADIAVEPLRAGNVAAEVLAPATVVAPPGSEAVIVARATGIVSKIDKRLGDPVRAGEVLALVESLQAATMVAEVQVAGTRADAARRLYERERSLFESGVTPRQDMEAAQAAMDVANAEVARASSVARSARVTANGQSIAVVSPISGRITAQRSVLGASVTTDAELFRVADTRSVQIEASVTALDTRRIAAGDPATVVGRAGAPLDAKVRSVTPTVSGDARAATVLLTLDGGPGELVVGEGVQVRLHTRTQGAGGFTVPEDAVQRIEGRDAVFVQTPEGFKVVPVLVGPRSNGVAQIVSGVQGNENVATRNAFLLKAELRKARGDE